MVPVVLWGMLGVMLGGGLGACSKRKQDEPGASMPAPVSQAELERGLAACKDYVEKVCACADARPEDAELGNLCHMAPAKLSNLDMASMVNRAPKGAVERVATERTIRKTVASCVEGIADLATRGCPH